MTCCPVPHHRKAVYAMAEKRKDNRGRNLITGEYYDAKNKRYMFRKMIDGERVTITAPDLAELRKQENDLLCRENLITFRTDSLIEDIKGIMAKKRFRDFPVLDGKGHYVGMISRRNVLNAGRKKVIMVDHNEKSQAVDGINFRWKNY